MLRLLFTKTDNAVWISHLDTMRLFQRAFKRSGFHLKHTQGFNPRPSVSIALPLSVSVESNCELLDFELEDDGVSCAEIKDGLNASLIDGVQVIDVYEEGQKLKYLRYLHCEIDLTYDGGISAESENTIRNLFNSTELLVEKKGKNGITIQDIIPMIRNIDVVRLDEKNLRINAVICCQEPSLNPSQLSAAIAKYLPDLTPSFVKCCRRELFDINNQVFR